MSGSTEPMTSKPSARLAVVACMDCRLDVETVLELAPGEAHVIRNAGGVLTDDVRRSLLLSQRSLGTPRIVLLHHTDCGLHGVDEERYLDEVEAELGQRPRFALGAFEDAASDVAEAIADLRGDPLVPYTEDVVGYVYDVVTGDLAVVDGASD